MSLEQPLEGPIRSGDWYDEFGFVRWVVRIVDCRRLVPLRLLLDGVTYKSYIKNARG